MAAPESHCVTTKVVPLSCYATTTTMVLVEVMSPHRMIGGQSAHFQSTPTPTSLAPLPRRVSAQRCCSLRPSDGTDSSSWCCLGRLDGLHSNSSTSFRRSSCLCLSAITRGHSCQSYSTSAQTIDAVGFELQGHAARHQSDS